MFPLVLSSQISSSKNAKAQISCPYETTEKHVILNTSPFSCLDVRLQHKSYVVFHSVVQVWESLVISMAFHLHVRKPMRLLAIATVLWKWMFYSVSDCWTVAGLLKPWYVGCPSGDAIVRLSDVHIATWTMDSENTWRLPSLGMWSRVSCKNRRFGGMNRLHHQGDKNQRAMNNVNNN
jgi:hypothetical protein